MSVGWKCVLVANAHGCRHALRVEVDSKRRPALAHTLALFDGVRNGGAGCRSVGLTSGHTLPPGMRGQFTAASLDAPTK